MSHGGVVTGVCGVLLRCYVSDNIWRGECEVGRPNQPQNRQHVGSMEMAACPQSTLA